MTQAEYQAELRAALELSAWISKATTGQLVDLVKVVVASLNGPIPDGFMDLLERTKKAPDRGKAVEQISASLKGLQRWKEENGR